MHLSINLFLKNSYSLIPHRFKFYLIYRDFDILLGHLVSCHLSTMICFRYFVVTFHLCVDISNNKYIKLDKDNKSNFDLWNWSYKYSNHCSFIKFIGFKTDLLYY